MLMIMMQKSDALVNYELSSTKTAMKINIHFRNNKWKQ